jgi:hypothetical protein
MVTEGAFLHNTFASYTGSGTRELSGRIVIRNNRPPDLLRNLDGRWRRAFNQRLIISPEGEGIFMIEVNYPIGAIYDAISATDTFVGVMVRYITI